MAVTLEPIGVVRSQYRKPYHAPRQAEVDDRLHDATIEIFHSSAHHQALHDLDGFDRIWMITYFDRVSSWKSKVLTPRSRIKRGVFATRSPHRPNPIGITCVRLVRIDGLTLHIGGCDALDGTPVLDIKPYLPYADSFPNAQAGWVDDLPTHQHNVVWLCEKPEHTDVVSHVERVLSADPHTHPYRRIKRVEGGIGELAVENLRFKFVLDGDTVTITGFHAEPSL